MFSRSFFIAAAAIALALPGQAAEKPVTPGALKGGKVITVAEAKSLLDAKGAAFFDTRTAINFGKGHVPGAKLIAYREKSDFKADFDGSQDQFELAKLPADKNAKVVIYSDGPSGWKSYKASVLAIQAGYKNVLWMREGSSGWAAKGYPMEQ